jgi:hypothetical protein
MASNTAPFESAIRSGRAEILRHAKTVTGYYFTNSHTSCRCIAARRNW